MCTKMHSPKCAVSCTSRTTGRLGTRPARRVGNAKARRPASADRGDGREGRWDGVCDEVAPQPRDGEPTVAERFFDGRRGTVKHRMTPAWKLSYQAQGRSPRLHHSLITQGIQVPQAKTATQRCYTRSTADRPISVATQGFRAFGTVTPTCITNRRHGLLDRRNGRGPKGTSSDPALDTTATHSRSGSGDFSNVRGPRALKRAFTHSGIVIGMLCAKPASSMRWHWPWADGQGMEMRAGRSLLTMGEAIEPRPCSPRLRRCPTRYWTYLTFIAPIWRNVS